MEPVHILDATEDLRRAIATWGTATKQQMLRELASRGLHQRVRSSSAIRFSAGRAQRVAPLYESIGFNIRKDREGVPSAINFLMARHGIFYERGVGKHRPAGSAAAARAAKPWITPTLEPALAQLSDEIAASLGRDLIDSFRVLIPGILDARVTIQ